MAHHHTSRLIRDCHMCCYALYPPPHAELRRWADVYVVAPLSANSLAKLANGLCDNLVTCVARAWDFQRPMLVSGAAGVPRNYCNPHLAK
jgi:hypothetical protein